MGLALGGRRDGGRWLAGLALWVFAALVALPGCGGSARSPGGVVGGESHFLESCSELGCNGELACVAGICTRACQVGVDSCSDLSSDAVCTDGGSAAGSSEGICDVQCVGSSDCAAWPGFLCESGLCRAPAAEPGAEGPAGATAAPGAAGLDGAPLGAIGLAQPAPIADRLESHCESSTVRTSFVLGGQYDIDRLAGCEEIDGDVYILNPQREALDFARVTSLRRVTGRLWIGCDPFGVDYSCAGLAEASSEPLPMTVPDVNLRGLDNLESVGSLMIGETGVKDLSPLRGLQGIIARPDSNADGTLRLVNNDSLTTLDGLQSLVALQRLSLEGNDQLTTLSGLTLPSSMQSIRIQTQWLLDNLSRLETVTSLEELYLQDLPVTDLEPLRNLTRLGWVSLVDLWELTALRGLSQLPAIDFLTLDNTALHDLDDLRLESAVSIELHNHGRLTQVDALAGVEVENLVAIGNTTLQSMPEFARLQEISELNIQGNASLLTAPRFPLLRAAGPIVIADTGASRVAFPALTDALSIEIRDNTNLVELDLSSLARVTSLQVTCNGLSEENLDSLRQIPVLQSTLSSSPESCVSGP